VDSPTISGKRWDKLGEKRAERDTKRGGGKSMVKEEEEKPDDVPNNRAITPEQILFPSTLQREERGRTKPL